MNEYMNEHKQLLSFSPKTSTVTSDFNLFGDSAKKTNIWPIVFIPGHMKDNPILISLIVKAPSIEWTQKNRCSPSCSIASLQVSLL